MIEPAVYLIAGAVLTVISTLALLSWIRVNNTQAKINEITLARLESEEAEFETEVDED